MVWVWNPRLYTSPGQSLRSDLVQKLMQQLNFLLLWGNTDSWGSWQQLSGEYRQSDDCQNANIIPHILRSTWLRVGRVVTT